MYLFIKALNNIQDSIRILSFPFLSHPPEAAPYKGIISHPGFHTTTNIDTAAVYGVGRVYNANTVDEGDGTHAVTDYPVVVGLDMGGYNRELDYDAEEMVKQNLIDTLNNIVNTLPDEYTHEDIENALYTDAGMSDYDGMVDDSNDPLSYLSDNQFSHFNNPIHAILNLGNPVQTVMDYIATGDIPKEVLMSVTDQFRYLDDVPHTKVLAVWYVTPVAPDMTDYQGYEEDGDQIVDAWPGFTVMDYDDIAGGGMSLDYTQVWGDKPAVPIEYHGTTYLRLLQAVPEFASQLPVPPSPPYSP